MGVTRWSDEFPGAICENSLIADGYIVTRKDVGTAGYVKLADAAGEHPAGVTIVDTEDRNNLGTYLVNERVAYVNQNGIEVDVQVTGNANRPTAIKVGDYAQAHSDGKATYLCDGDTGMSVANTDNPKCLGIFMEALAAADDPADGRILVQLLIL